MEKLRRTDGATEYTLTLAYEAYAASDGVIEVPGEVATWALGTGLYELVKEAEEKPRRVRREAPPAIEEEDN